VERFVSFDGTEIAYQEWGSDRGAPPVVLHHGYVVDANVNWVLPGVVDALVAAGRRVVAPDARGHGASGKPHDPARYGEDRMARDLGVLFDLVGADQVDLVGYSMGGIVALIVAADERRVRRLVVGGIGAAAVELGGVDTRVRPDVDMAAALLADDPASIADPLALQFREFADALGADRAALAAQARAVHASPIALDRIAAPTLVLAGRDDVLATRPQVLAAAIADARLRLLDGDHLSAVANPAFAPAIVDFLAAPAPAR
jgi:pimeloyl-ACP methyl ester carboxylesterase